MVIMQIFEDLIVDPVVADRLLPYMTYCSNIWVYLPDTNSLIELEHYKNKEVQSKLQNIIQEIKFQ